MFFMNVVGSKDFTLRAAIIVSRMITEKKSYLSIELATQACADHVVARLNFLSGPLLFFYSGGSCLPVLSTLIESFSLHKKTNTVTFAPIDERFEKENNTFIAFQQKYSSSYNKALQLGYTFIDTSPHKKDQYDMAKWYEKQIYKQIEETKTAGGNILGLVGMGNDGHVAGIFPDSQEKEFYNDYVDTNHIVVGLDATGKHACTKRFTLSVKGFECIHEYVLFLSGDFKKKTLSFIENKHVALHMMPASYLFYTSRPCTIFTS